MTTGLTVSPVNLINQTKKEANEVKDHNSSKYSGVPHAIRMSVASHAKDEQS